MNSFSTFVLHIPRNNSLFQHGPSSMKPINEYRIDALDLSELEKFFLNNGKEIRLKRNDFLLRQGERCRFVGYLQQGICRHLHDNSRGEEQIVGFSPQHHFVSDYAACLCGKPAQISIQAVKEILVFVLPYEQLETFWNSSEKHQCMGRMVAEQLFVMTYRRLIDRYCQTPEERYLSFLQHYPELKEELPLREIASFIGVTPETVSKIRKRISFGQKS